MMKDPKPVFIIVGGILLFFVLTQVIPWQVLIMIAFLVLILLAFFGHLQQQVAKEQSAAIPQYQPPQQPSQEPEPPPRTNPPLGFDLTAEEYRLLSQSYQQGYQAQTPLESPNWSPFSGFTHNSDQPKQDRPFDYEQPQAQYPQEMPPLA